jgi:hypothetical protein
MSERKDVPLYYRSEPLGRPIDRPYLQAFLDEYPGALLSLEPAIALPEYGGRIRTGRHPHFQPLGYTLPPEGLVIQEAAIYAARTWIVLAAPQVVSDWPGRRLVWSLDAFEPAQRLDDITRECRKALAWRDRQRFGLPEKTVLDEYDTERFYRGAELIAWRIVPSPQGD